MLTPRRGLLLLIIVIPVVWLAMQWFMAPEEQLRQAQLQLIKNMESRSWLSISSTLSDTYLDDWGQDSNTAQNAMRMVLGGFTELRIKQEIQNVEHARSSKSSPELGIVEAMLRVEGQGSGLSDRVMSESERLVSPWMFHWRKEGSWPWSWKLTQIHHDDVNVPTSL
jgi:hypothetical protein